MDFTKIEFLEKNRPASEADIDLVESKIKGVLPDIYKEFLKTANGMILNLCVLYDTKSIAEMYDCNEFAEYAPEYVSIGNDNGDREIIMKAEKDAVFCGFLDAGSIGISQPDQWFEFQSWVQNGCDMSEVDDDEME